MLLLVAEVRWNDELTGFVEAETAADVIEAALNSEGSRGENDSGDLLKDLCAKELGDVDGCGLEKRGADG
ncbi:MAG: hypothetical protein WDM87_09355 [Terracidiphilus sp.]